MKRCIQAGAVMITGILVWLFTDGLWPLTDGRRSQQEERGAAETPSPSPLTDRPAAESKPSAAPVVTAATPAPEETAPKPDETILELRRQYENDDIMGYISMEGTSVNYPVTQAKDNVFYLDYDIYKNKSVSGWIFLDYENDITRADKNTVIYGHNMKNGTMFHDLRYYQSEEFYRDHRYIVFNTLYDQQTWEIFSFYETDTSFNYIRVIFPAPEDFYELVLAMKTKSFYDTGVTVTAEDRILTLSTCSGRSGDSRYVLNAKLLA